MTDFLQKAGEVHEKIHSAIRTYRRRRSLHRTWNPCRLFPAAGPIGLYRGNSLDSCRISRLKMQIKAMFLRNERKIV